MKSAVQGVHCTADHGAVLTFNTVFDGNQSFSVLGRNAEDTCEPHPEDCSRAAHRDRSSYTDDIAGTDGRGKRSGQSAELGDIAFRVRILGDRKLDCLEDILLNKAGTERHEEMCPEQKDDERPTPQETVGG